MSENMNENMNEISLDKQDVSVEEPKAVEEVPVVEASNEPIISMEKPVEPVQSVQQPVQPVQQPISTPIESVNVPNVNPYAFTPIEPKQKKKKEDLTTEELVLKQNNILKWLCLVLCVFSVFSFCMSMASYNKNSKTELLVAAPSLSEPILTTVESGKEMSAAQIYAENIDSVVTIQTEIITQSFFQQYVGGATGSGFVISDDGYILTNAHVIEGANSIKVTFESGDTFSATLVGTEEDNDLAVIKIETPYVLNPVVMGDSDEVIIGEDVFAIGNPLGELTFSITKGIVSAINREIQIDTFNSINMFQVDCAVNEGNSGGPIFNNKGQVIGIVSAKYASETIEGLGFCIPITDALTIVTDLIEI